MLNVFVNASLTIIVAYSIYMVWFSVEERRALFLVPGSIGFLIILIKFVLGKLIKRNKEKVIAIIDYVVSCIFLFLLYSQVSESYHSYNESKKLFQSSQKDFICNEDAFLSVDDSPGIKVVYFHQKRGGILYDSHAFYMVGTLKNGRQEDAYDKELFEQCKNKDGKTINQLYPPIN